MLPSFLAGEARVVDHRGVALRDLVLISHIVDRISLLAGGEMDRLEVLSKVDAGEGGARDARFPGAAELVVDLILKILFCGIVCGIG